MSFFGIGKSKKNQNSSLPAATRDISSSHGDTRSNTANGANGPRQGIERTGTAPTTQSAGPSANPSLESMRATDLSSSAPEPGKVLRQRAESDLSVSAASSQWKFAIVTCASRIHVHGLCQTSCKDTTNNYLGSKKQFGANRWPSSTASLASNYTRNNSWIARSPTAARRFAVPMVTTPAQFHQQRFALPSLWCRSERYGIERGMGVHDGRIGQQSNGQG